VNRARDLEKDNEKDSVASEIVPIEGRGIEQGALAMEVNGTTKQSSIANKMIWNIREIFAKLSLFYHLQRCEITYTGRLKEWGDGIKSAAEGILLALRLSEGLGVVTLSLATSSTDL
jgi:fumarylpyruvate hydrolase